MSYRNIEFVKDAGVAKIILNRPDALNAINREMLLELIDVFDACAKDAEIRCVVLTGNGKAFCAGGDIKLFAGFSKVGNPEEEFKKVVGPLHEFIRKVSTTPKPVIASVQGFAMGAGFSLMLACDIVIASEVARFGSAYTALGITPDGGLTYFLPRLIGAKRATEIIFSNRMVDVNEALKLGMVNLVVPAGELEKITKEWAIKLANGPTKAYARVKELLGSSPSNSLDKQLDAEIERIAASGTTEDFRAGVTAFLEKKLPTFKGR